LERIDARQIGSVGGREVLQYRGTSLSLLTLEKYIQAAPRAALDKLFVVVFKVGARDVGLVVPELADIRDVTTEIDTTTFREPGVIGSFVVENKAVRLLDIYELTRAARPDWFSDTPAAAVVVEATAARAPTIVLAEDSSFFRKQLVSYLEAEQYVVVGCEDGQVAWETLKQPGQEYDLLITDIEMPRLDGFQLSEKVKHDPALRHLPIIAVTSLASEEDMQRGRQVGIDEYLIKLDRERLMELVAQFLRPARQTGGRPQPVASGMGR
jgi:two-component system, chemotaxis family, sensor kinase CheA